MSAGWIVIGSSARGAAHARGGRANQDAIDWTPRAGGPRIAAAVSDGHGAAPHFRSDMGARLAVAGASKLISWQLDEVDSDGSDVGLINELGEHWRTEVRTHAAQNPFSDAEAAVAGGDVYTPYGATLIAFGATPEMIVAWQIGDGDLMLGYPNGRISRAILPDAGLVGEETYSLCLPDAASRFRHRAIRNDADDGWPDFICAGTDGVAKSFADDAAFTAAIGQLRRNAANDWKGLAEALPDWLFDLSERGSGDDCTLCIALSSRLTGSR